ncbi:hypothetical protein EMCRGX_G009782 [Ephydatia muelleri]
MKPIDDSNFKNAFSIKSLLAPMEELTLAKEGSEVHLSSVPSACIPTKVLDTIPITIRDVLKCKKPYTSLDARTLLVPLADVPQAYIASLLTLSKKYAGSLHFKAKIDKLYLTECVALQEYRHSRSHVNSAMVNLATKFIYGDDNISRLAWEATKCFPNRDLRWKGLANMFAMRSLVLKHDIATMYREYLDRQRAVMPGMLPIGKTLFYIIANNITGGGKLQEPRAGVDYLKVNFHTDNFTIIDKVIDVLAPLSDVDHTLQVELLGLHSGVFTFLSYGFAVHVRSGVKASEVTVVQSHKPQEHEAHQFTEYKKLRELLSQPDLFNEPATQESFINQVRNQLNICANIRGSVTEQGENNCASTHSPAYALDLVPDRRPNMNPKLAGHMDCSACRGTFLFYDRLRHVAIAKLDQDPTRLAEIADMLLSIYQCEHRTFRYMAHVMLAAQQSHKMKQAIAEMDSSTAYFVFDNRSSWPRASGRVVTHITMGKKQEAEMTKSVCDVNDNINYGQDEDVDVQEKEDEDVQDEDVQDVDEDVQDEEVQDEEVQDVDVQDEEVQDEDVQDEEVQDEDVQDEDVQDKDVQDKDVQDEDVQDKDVKDEDVQDEDVQDDDVQDEDGEQRADGKVVLSCLEASLHALRQRFPYVTKIIVQSDNAKNLAGKQTKLLLPYVCSAAGLKLLAY